MFDDQKSYMWLHTDDEIASFDEKDLLNLLKENDFSLENSKSLTKKELANQLKKYKRIRCLMLWHDGSSVSNHCHIMMMVSCMYDHLAFVTKAEHYAKHGFHRNVQSIIEKPYVYILARCPLMTISYSIPYSIPKLEHQITNNEISITDVTEIFKGDNSAAQFESGQQKNDDYFCWQCRLLAPLSPNIAHTMSLPNLPPEFPRFVPVKHWFQNYGETVSSYIKT